MFIYKYRDGHLWYKPDGISDATLRGFGARKPGKGEQFWRGGTRFADLALLENMGYTGRMNESDLQTKSWVQAQLRQRRLDEYLQVTLDIIKEAKVDAWSKLFPHQKVGASFLVSRKRALLSLTPGLGKTNTSVTAVEILDAKKILVVAPLTLLMTWEREVLSWSSAQPEQISRQKGKYKPQDGVKWYITNIDSVMRNLESWCSEDWDVIIADESILYKNWKANRSKAMVELGKKGEYVWLLSGNPVAKYSDDLYSQMRILYPDDFTSYWRFANMWCTVESTPWGDKIVGNRDPKGLRKYLDDVIITRTPKEAFDESLGMNFKFPDLILEPVYVDLTGEQLELISKLEQEAALEKDNGKVMTITAAIAMLTRVQQIVSAPINIGINKVSVKTDTALDLLDRVELPAIVWFQFRDGLEDFARLATEKGWKVGKIHGGVPDKVRFQAVDDFQNGQLDIICIQLDTGKFGLSITKAKSVIYHDRNMSLDSWMQSTHRVRRLSSTWEAVGYVIHGGFTDFLIDRIIREKITSLDQLSMTDILEATFKTLRRALPVGKNKTHAPAVKAK